MERKSSSYSNVVQNTNNIPSNLFVVHCALFRINMAYTERSKRENSVNYVLHTFLKLYKYFEKRRTRIEKKSKRWKKIFHNLTFPRIDFPYQCPRSQNYFENPDLLDSRTRPPLPRLSPLAVCLPPSSFPRLPRTRPLYLLTLLAPRASRDARIKPFVSFPKQSDRRAGKFSFRIASALITLKIPQS